MKDISTRTDIELLVNEFYKQVLQDDVISHFFTEVVVLDWDKHIPVMYDFWESILLGKMNYKGNPMIKHLIMSEKEPLESKHFKRWLKLWKSTLEEHFHGAKADEAFRRASQIAGMIEFKVGQRKRKSRN